MRGMSEDRKRAGAGFWITVALVAVLVGYPLGFGPACWLAGSDRLPTVIDQTICHIYGPLADCAIRRKDPIGRALWWWSEFGCKRGAYGFYIRPFDRTL